MTSGTAAGLRRRARQVKWQRKTPATPKESWGSFVGETGFEPATPWSRRAAGRSARRGTGWHRFVSPRQHWGRDGRRFPPSGTVSTRCDAVWCISGAGDTGAAPDGWRGRGSAPGIASDRLPAGSARRHPCPPSLERHPHPRRRHCLVEVILPLRQTNSPPLHAPLPGCQGRHQWRCRWCGSGRCGWSCTSGA